MRHLQQEVVWALAVRGRVGKKTRNSVHSTPTTIPSTLNALHKPQLRVDKVLAKQVTKLSPRQRLSPLTRVFRVAGLSVIGPGNIHDESLKI
jgi:hypothetical protein